jgi:hypothetical protein
LRLNIGKGKSDVYQTNCGVVVLDDYLIWGDFIRGIVLGYAITIDVHKGNADIANAGLCCFLIIVKNKSEDVYIDYF